MLFDEAFKYGDGAKFWGYVGTNAEQLRVEFCNLRSVVYLKKKTLNFLLNNVRK
jgi:hypothetical protein